MWWFFSKQSETDGTVLYAYSRESRELDGMLAINQHTQAIEVVHPCARDAGSSFAISKVVEKAYRLIAKDYPSQIQIACG